MSSAHIMGVSLVACALSFAVVGCGENNGAGRTESELQELRKEVAQVKNEIREMRRSIDRRQARESGVRRFPMEHARRMENGMTNGVSRMRYSKPRPTREEMEARRKMMQDPEMRKKFGAERKARMEERRRMHEERRREMEARRQSRSAGQAAPAADGGAAK